MGNPICQDWVRLEVLILRRACAILRKIYNKRWLSSQKTEWANNAIFGKEFISGIGAKFYESAGRLQKLTLEEGDVNNWDFIMLAKILQSVDFPNISNIEIQEENRRIDELMNLRKKASEYPNKSMDDKEFSGYWDAIEHILVSFGESEKELEELKLSPSISEEHLLLSEETSPKNDDNIAQARQLKEESKYLANNNKFTEAIETLTKAISLSGVPDIELGSLYASRSEAFLKSSASEKDSRKTELVYLALKDAKKAISMRPMWGLAYFRVGMAYLDLNKLKKACKYLDQALEREPSLEEIQTARKNCVVKLVKLENKENYDFDPAAIAFASVGDQSEAINHGGNPLSPGIREFMDTFGFLQADENPLACIWKGHQLRDGQEMKQNLRQAAVLYRKGVNSCNAEGMYNLALLKIEGRGVKQDYPGAIKLLKKASSQPFKVSNIYTNGSLSVSNIGVPDAEFVLGLLHAEGIGMAQRDHFVAAVWYLNASDHGHGGAANNLAVMRHKGLGVMRSAEKALQLWKLAASRKVSHAMHALAIHYLKEWDIAEARKWLQQAIRSSQACEIHGFLAAAEEKEDFDRSIEQIRAWKNRFQHKEISTWETAQGLCGKNLCMKERIVRMLKKVSPDTLTVHEHVLNRLTPKSVRIPFENVKSVTRTRNGSTTPTTPTTNGEVQHNNNNHNNSNGVGVTNNGQEVAVHTNGTS